MIEKTHPRDGRTVARTPPWLSHYLRLPLRAEAGEDGRHVFCAVSGCSLSGLFLSWPAI